MYEPEMSDTPFGDAAAGGAEGAAAAAAGGAAGGFDVGGMDVPMGGEQLPAQSYVMEPGFQINFIARTAWKTPYYYTNLEPIGTGAFGAVW